MAIRKRGGFFDILKGENCAWIVERYTLYREDYMQTVDSLSPYAKMRAIDDFEREREDFIKSAIRVDIGENVYIVNVPCGMLSETVTVIMKMFNDGKTQTIRMNEE